ncbi:MAG TPA: hypothetical protein VGO68_05565 [Pyrinomonadaceae bacterium]|jgi:hypothetical protein|nr:hypothetical protein [Pyrinomonadaceae bacterium]
MSAQVESWRVSTPEGVFETDLETLKQWIVEGCVQPNDKVSKGNLNWLEAGRVPMLREAFAAEVVPYQPEVAAASSPAADVTTEKAPARLVVVPTRSAAITAADTCTTHPDVAGKYICRECGNSSCDECTKFVGASKIPLCPVCGDLCKPAEQLRHKAARQELQSSGFGVADFGRALAYPLQHKVALLFGAAFYGLLLLVGFRGRLLASVIMFGCISHVISQVAWGRMNRSFMPDFSEFSLWDDLAVPFFLGIGITIVTWGPIVVLVIALLFGIFSGSAVTRAQLTQTPTAEQAGPNQKDLSVLLDPNADPKKLEEANNKLNQLRPGYRISQEAERSKKELNDPSAELLQFVKLFPQSLLFIGLLLLSLGWAIFYYPMALTVAGYTQSFGSVVNPLVGLDTIRRMGLTYFKAFGMVVVIQGVGFVLALIVAAITAPLALPFFGNLPAMFIDGSLTFYFNLVIACLLGLSLYKCADRLGINVD